MESLAYYKTYLGCFLLGLLAAILTTPFVIRLAQRCSALDHPGTRKIHRQSTPLWGGLGVFLGMWAPLLFLAFWDNAITQRVAGHWNLFLALFASGAAMLALGIVDDKLHLNARWKFLVQIPVALLLVQCGICFGNVTVPGLGTVDLGLWGPPLTVLWIVGVTNAVNLIDGIDGLAAGVTFFVAGTNAIVAILNGHEVLALAMCSLGGGCLGFLRYNYAPARIFLGDTGSLFIGMTMAVLSVGANAKGTVAASLFVPLLVLGYPIIDTLLAMARRGLLGRSMFSGDRGHIHHRLLALGLSQQKTVWVLYGLCLLFSAVALAAVLDRSQWLAAGLVALTCVLFTGLWLLGFFRYFSPRQVILERAQLRNARARAEEFKAHLEAATRREEVFRLLEKASLSFGLHGLDISDDSLGKGAACRRWEALANPETGLMNDASKALRCERFEFSDSVLALSGYYLVAKEAEDLSLEYLVQLGHIFTVANQTLERIGAARSVFVLPPVRTEAFTEALSHGAD